MLCVKRQVCARGNCVALFMPIHYWIFQSGSSERMIIDSRLWSAGPLQHKNIFTHSLPLLLLIMIPSHSLSSVSHRAAGISDSCGGQLLNTKGLSDEPLFRSLSNLQPHCCLVQRHINYSITHMKETLSVKDSNQFNSILLIQHSAETIQLSQGGSRM